jgi:hypothetical protein
MNNANNLPNFIIPRKRKNYFDCNYKHKSKQLKFILEQAKHLGDLSKTIGLKINEIVLGPTTIEQNIPKITVSPLDISEKQRKFKFLKAKDISNLSNKNYIFQKKALLGIQRMPGITGIKKLQNELNRFFTVSKNDYGYFCQPAQKIKFVCESFLLRYPEFKNQSFKIKLSIDSTLISSSQVQLLNVSFNHMDDTEIGSSIEGTYLLGSFEIAKEDYDEVKKSLKELLILLEDVKYIQIADKNYQIIFYLGCDYKMSRIIYGQKASNSLDG